jgi:hypothetical protein
MFLLVEVELLMHYIKNIMFEQKLKSCGHICLAHWFFIICNYYSLVMFIIVNKAKMFHIIHDLVDPTNTSKNHSFQMVHLDYLVHLN